MITKKTPTKPKTTVAQLKQKVEELLTIKGMADRYNELKDQIKEDMISLKWHDVDIPGKGRVFISPSTKREYSTTLVETVLGTILANKIIQVKRSVSNEILDAFIKAGEISKGDVIKLEEGAKQTPVVALNIRPLK